jgi:hypothetical protein
MQDQKSIQPRPGGPAPAYEKLCCLFLGWKDATDEKNEQVRSRIDKRISVSLIIKYDR